jgi:hypothetical protein
MNNKLPNVAVPPGVYWANVDQMDIGGVVQDKVRRYKDHCVTNGRYDIWQRAYRTYYGCDADGGYRNSIAVTFGGADGENVELRGNLFRMFVRARAVLATGNRPSFQCRPRAYDGSTTELVAIGNAICDMYLDKTLETRMGETTTTAIVAGEGWLGTFWDPYAGQRLSMTADGQPGYEGDVDYASFRPDEVCRDVDVTDDVHDWVIVLRRRNRWTLAARYPVHAQHILAAAAFDADTMFGDIKARSYGVNEGRQDADQIVTWEFYHRPTEACPAGRMSLVVGDVAIADSPNLYEKLPVRPIMPSKETATSWGYGESWDLLALSQAFDSVLTQMITAKENFGMLNLIMPAGGSVDVENLTKSARAYYASSPPVPFDSVGRAVDSGISTMGFIQTLMRDLMSMNEASMGSGSSAPSGASLAMSMQIATQNNAGLVRTYLQTFRDTMTDTILLLKQFATNEKVIHISGKLNANKVKRFKGEDLAALDGVDVELGSAEMRTTQMRHQIVTELLAAKLLTSPEQALQMMSTGRLEPAFNGPAAREACIERENEALMSGQPQIVLDQDFHADHIARHGALLADPESRANPALVELVQAHMYEHAIKWSTMSVDPVGMSILAATGQQPSPAPPPPPGMVPGMPGQGPNGQADPMAPPMPPNPGGDVVDPTTNPQGPSPGPADMPALPPDARPIPTTYEG